MKNLYVMFFCAFLVVAGLIGLYFKIEPACIPLIFGTLGIFAIIIDSIDLDE